MLNGWFYIDDIIELWLKVRQRGLSFIMDKFSFNANNRTISSFKSHFAHANWWIIPAVGKRINEKITGDPDLSYEPYTSAKYLTKCKHMVSIGCGAGSHELLFAKLNHELHVKAYDFSTDLINEAKRKASILNLKNVEFLCKDVYKITLEEKSVDCFLFHASLHHFKDIDLFLINKVIPALKDGGLIIMYEYVGPNRMAFSNHQIDFCNETLKTIPKDLRKLLRTKGVKSKVYRLGRFRMLISDPSECVDSESIIPSLHKYCKILEEKAIGGNIAMPVLKHIAHNFLNNGTEALHGVFDMEDKYLQKNSADFVFGVYQKKTLK